MLKDTYPLAPEGPACEEDSSSPSATRMYACGRHVRIPSPTGQIKVSVPFPIKIPFKVALKESANTREQYHLRTYILPTKASSTLTSGLCNSIHFCLLEALGAVTVHSRLPERGSGKSVNQRPVSLRSITDHIIPSYKELQV